MQSTSVNLSLHFPKQNWAVFGNWVYKPSVFQPMRCRTLVYHETMSGVPWRIIQFPLSFFFLKIYLDIFFY